MPQARELRPSAILLGIAAALFAALWLTEVAGDPTDGFAFYTLVYATPLLVGIGLVVAASRRRDLFGTPGFVGSILVFVGALMPDIIGFVAAAAGLLLITLSLTERGRPLLTGVAILLAGVVGLALRLESGDGILIFLPVLVLGTAVLAGTLRSLDR